ncbi:hypothetical protein ACH4E8_34345 [Streptomyces sp. NPDC017979]|uniref:hypothetical protein n=1 Tax=Streptomyces sp. NPDC017979 TaxID=3365024 RepID=UPI00379484E5
MSDTSYTTLQRTLRTIAAAMENACDALADVQAVMKGNALFAAETAGLLDDADGDARYVEMTSAISTLLWGVVIDTRQTRDAAADVGSTAQEAAARHKSKYGPLDELRTTRSTKTPKPGFFDED